MITSEVLLLPHTGEQFTRCLKTAALYSERIYCISSIAPSLMSKLCTSSARPPGTATQGFLDAAKAHESDFALLSREGILATPEQFDQPSPDEPSDEERLAVYEKILLTCYVRYEIAKRLVRSGKVNASFLEQSGRNRAMRSSRPRHGTPSRINFFKLETPKTAGNSARSFRTR